MKKTGIRTLALFLSLVMLILPTISLATERNDSNEREIFTSLEGQTVTVKKINSRMIEVDGEIHLLSGPIIKGIIEGVLVSETIKLGDIFFTHVVNSAYDKYEGSIMQHFNQLSAIDKLRVSWYVIKLFNDTITTQIKGIESYDPAGCVLAPGGSYWNCPYFM